MTDTKSNSNFDINEQMKNMTPEAWANMQKSMVQGEMQMIKSGPWYYKLFVIGFIILFIGVLLFIISRGINIYNEEKEFNQRFENSSLTR